MVGDRIGLGHLVTLPFAGNHMQKLRPGELLDVLQRGNEGVQVVAVDGAYVIKPKLFKQGGGHHHAFGVLLNALGQLEQSGRAFEHAFTYAFSFCIKLPAHQLR